jgi:hypothetical protein
MKRAPNLLALLALAVVAVSGCYTMEIDATAMQPPIAMTGPTGQVQTLGHFEGRTTGSWLFWGLMPLRDPDVVDVLEREVRRLDGTGFTSVEIVTQQTFMDGFLSLLTLGIYGQRSTIVTGTVVR